ncbi:MAG: hypothetical protein ACSLFI_03855 [Solirubrobacterales bacterium]
MKGFKAYLGGSAVFLAATVIASAVPLPSSQAERQTVRDRPDSGQYVDIKKVTIARKHKRVRFVVEYRRPPSYPYGRNTKITIVNADSAATFGSSDNGGPWNISDSRFEIAHGDISIEQVSFIDRGHAKYRFRPTKHIISFPLSAIANDVKGFDWRIRSDDVGSGARADLVPDSRFKTWRVGKRGHVTKPKPDPKPEPNHLPRKRITFRNGVAVLKISCPLSRRCRGRVEIGGAGLNGLIKPVRYSVPPGESRKVRLRLNAAGGETLGYDGRAHSQGRLIAKSGEVLKFVAIMISRWS